jgi:RIO-like serine/threonine protein kinase
VLRDVLVALHMITRAGEHPALSRVAQRANVSDRRLKERLHELDELGLVDNGWSITQRGYEYMADFKKHIEPVLRKYGLGGHREIQRSDPDTR